MTKKTRSVRNKPRQTSVTTRKGPENGPESIRGSSLDAFMLFDENLNCIDISTAGKRLSEASDEAWFGRNIRDISPDTVKSGRYEKYLNVVKTGVPFVARDEVTMSEFGTVQFDVKAFRAGNGLALVFSDIADYKAAEEALSESRASYLDLIEGISDIVFTISPDGRLIALNAAFETITGWSRAEWIGKPSVSLVHPDDVLLSKRIFRRLLVGEKITMCELRILTMDGGCLVAELAMTPQIRDGKVASILGFARDITEQRKDEEVLRIKDCALASAINGIIMADLAGNVTYVNRSFLRMWGYDSVKEVLERNSLDFWEAKEKAVATVQAIFKKGECRDELVALRKDGSTFDVQLSASLVRDENKKPICMMASFIDITDHKRADKALQDSEEHYRSLMENALEGIVVLNADGTFRYESPSMERLLGYNPEDRIGKNMFEFELVHPDDVAEAGESFARLIKNAGLTIHAEVRGKHVDGSWRTLEIIGRNLVDDPRVQGIVANFRDVTERKRMEEALRESEEEFRRLVEDMNDGYCVLQESRVVFANARSARMFGYRQREVVGKTVEELLPGEIVSDLAKMRAKRRRDANMPGQYETILVGKDGTARPVELGTRMTEYAGKPALSVVIRDIGERKKAEEALRESEKHFSALVGSITDGVFKFREGVVTWCNDRVEELYGCSKDEMIGIEASFFYPEDMSRQEYTRAVSAEIRERGLFRGINVVQRPDGSVIDVEYTISPIPDSDPIELVATVRDITERKRMEEALRESEDKFRRFVEKMNDGYCVLQGFNVVFANTRAAEMFGYSPEEVIGRTIQELLPSQIVEELAEVHVKRRRGERVPTQYETTLTRRDGSELPVEFGVRLIDYLGKRAVSVVFRDITERRRMEEALRRSEQNYRVLFESRLDGVCVVDAETAKIRLANQVAAAMYGFDSPENMVGLDPLDFIHADDRARAMKSLVEGMFRENRQEIEEYRTVTRDGREMWVSTVGTRMEYEGKMAGLISVRDITERKRAEQERQSLEQQLQLTGRLAAVGELAAGVAHELNNPLAAVQAFAQFLTSRKDLDETVRSDVETIYKEAQRATRITSNLLSFARRHKPEKSLISINEVLEKSLELHAYRMKVNNIAVLTELDPKLPETMADFHQIQQVFVNIITNAEHAMTEGCGQGKLHIRTQTAGKMIRTTFTDDGPGISEENLKRIFDPFFTSKDVGKGTGLGLSICFGIIQEHGGYLYARSKPGKGSTFVVEIPIITEDQLSIEQNAVAESQGVQNG